MPDEQLGITGQVTVEIGGQIADQTGGTEGAPASPQTGRFAAPDLLTLIDVIS